MKQFRLLVAIAVVLAGCAASQAQDLQEINRLWQQTLDAKQRGEKDRAQATFRDFNQKVRSYMRANGRNWQVQYLVGSLNCQFPETKASGAKLLEDILQNNRALNNAGERELRRQLAACTSPAVAPISDARPDLPHDIADASAHFQAPGVHGDMKGGYSFKVDNESTSVVSPIPASELLSRRFKLDQPQEALKGALGRLPPGATGGVVEGFAVVTTDADKSRALAIGNCLKDYVSPLLRQFDIKPSNYMVTIYTADETDQVYDYARKLHGLELPRDVVAYSVAEDMSLAAVAGPGACGSMAHELVHLLIKQNFPLAPAWLEEGLASEVAVATPSENQFSFSYSWRDDTLKHNSGLRPKVAELLLLSWSSLNAHSQFEMREAAAKQAMVAVFIRYLDFKGKLSDVYFAVRDHHLSSDLSEYKSYAEILEEKLGMDADEIDRDFGQWFSQQKSRRPVSPTDSGSAEATDMVPNSTGGCQTINMVAQQASTCPSPIMNQRSDPPPRPKN
jgi:hypothetical protein